MNAQFFGEYLHNMRNNIRAESGDDGHLSCSSAPARPSRRLNKKLRRRRKTKSSSNGTSKLRGKLVQAKSQISGLYLRIKGLQKSLKASETLCRKQVLIHSKIAKITLHVPAYAFLLLLLLLLLLQAADIALKQNQTRKAKQLADLYKRKCILVYVDNFLECCLNCIFLYTIRGICCCCVSVSAKTAGLGSAETEDKNLLLAV